jgi:uncharacterized membrane protein
MKKYFFTGLILLLPLAITFAVVIFLVNFFTGPFVGVMQSILLRYDLFQKGLLFLSREQVLLYTSQALILILLFLSIVILGIFARWFFIRYLIRIGDYLLHRIPVVSSVYKTSQDVINTIFTTSSKSFKQVVLVPFPNESTYTIGLITQEQLDPFEKGETKPLVAVFVPTTPNPTSGFLMLFKEEDLTYLDISVEDAFKYSISCGVILPPFKAVSKEEGKKIEEGQ